MITDRAPALAERVDEILDRFLDGTMTRRKRNYYLNRVREDLPPKWCGCHLCTVKAKRESSEKSELVLVEQEDGA